MKSKYRPSAYFPLFGNEFFQAVEGYSDSIALAYLHALWHYWHHCHCEGLPDDDDYLRRVCHCLVSDWVRTKGILFDNDKFFTLEHGKWHQGRAIEEHKRSVEIYVSRVKSAANARKHNLSHTPETMPDSIHDSKPESTPGSTMYLSQSQECTKKQTNNGHPALKDVLAAASISGMKESDAEDFWNHFESVGWIDKNGHAIVNWRAKMATWKTKSRESEYKSRGSTTNASDVVAGILKGV